MSSLYPAAALALVFALSPAVQAKVTVGVCVEIEPGPLDFKGTDEFLSAKIDMGGLVNHEWGFDGNYAPASIWEALRLFDDPQKGADKAREAWNKSDTAAREALVNAVLERVKAARQAGVEFAAAYAKAKAACEKMDGAPRPAGAEAEFADAAAAFDAASKRLHIGIVHFGMCMKSFGDTCYQPIETMRENVAAWKKGFEKEIADALAKKEEEKKRQAAVDEKKKAFEAKRKGWDERMAKGDINAAGEMLTGAFDMAGVKVQVGQVTQGVDIDGDGIADGQMDLEIAKTDWDKLTKEKREELMARGFVPDVKGGGARLTYRAMSSDLQKQVDEFTDNILAGKPNSKITTTKKALEEADGEEWLKKSLGNSSISKLTEDSHSVEELDDKLGDLKSGVGQDYSTAATDLTKQCEAEGQKIFQDNAGAIAKNKGKIPADVQKKYDDTVQACTTKQQEQLKAKHDKMRALGAAEKEVQDAKKEIVRVRIKKYIGFLGDRSEAAEKRYGEAGGDNDDKLMRHLSKKGVDDLQVAKKMGDVRAKLKNLREAVSGDEKAARDDEKALAGVEKLEDFTAKAGDIGKAIADTKNAKKEEQLFEERHKGKTAAFENALQGR